MNTPSVVYLVVVAALALSWAVAIKERYIFAPVLALAAGATFIFSGVIGFVMMVLTFGQFDPIRFIEETLKAVYRQTIAMIILIAATIGTIIWTINIF